METFFFFKLEVNSFKNFTNPEEHSHEQVKKCLKQCSRLVTGHVSRDKIRKVFDCLFSKSFIRKRGEMVTKSKVPTSYFRGLSVCSEFPEACSSSLRSVFPGHHQACSCTPDSAVCPAWYRQARELLPQTSLQVALCAAH